MDPAANDENNPPAPPALVSQNGSAGDSVSEINNNYNDVNNNNNNSGTTTRGSIAERRAVKCGFKAERINTPCFRTDACSLSSPVVRSPLLTIPPGISPTSLLDSPILLPNSQPSPTTGTFSVPFADDGFGSSFRVKAEKVLDDDAFPEFSSLVNQGSNGDLQKLVLSGQPVDFEFPTELPKGATTMILDGDLVTSVKFLESKTGEASFGDLQNCGPDLSTNENHQQKVPAFGGYMGKQSPEEQQEDIPAADMGMTSEDGYNWRKYGQKQVKGSEYPRSYYKCTHPNCQVKKKIERSHDGEITEIIYKGGHNHPKPLPTRQAASWSDFSFDGMPEMEEDSGTSVKPEVVPAWKSSESGSKDMKVGSASRLDGLERTSSTSVVTELSDPLSTTQGRSVGAFESAGNPELSLTIASLDDNDDDGTTQASISPRVDADDEESESKRRKLDSCLVETNLTSRAVREPRVVVQIESEVDILDDGYRWRKYGQKVVKGNPNPRSYYKCTSPGCSVRKHVERASHNVKYVITTYEGKHNHEVPAARNSNQTNSSGSNLPPNPSNAQPGMAFGRQMNGPKPEPRMQDYTPSFDRKQVFNNAYMRPSFPRSFGNEVRLGTSSIYSMKLPSMQSPMPYGPFGCNSNHATIHHSASIASLVPNFPISVASSLQPSANVSLPRGDFSSNGKLVRPVQPFLSGQQFIRPKQEHEDNMYDVGQPIVDRTNMPSPSASSSLYQHIMGNFSA